MLICTANESDRLKIAIKLGTWRKNWKSRHNRGWSSLFPSDAMSKTTKHDGKGQKEIRENMVHLYATSSWIWPMGLNIGPQSRNSRSGLQTNYGRPRVCITAKSEHKYNLYNASTYVSRTHANAFKHSHTVRTPSSGHWGKGAYTNISYTTCT